MNIDSLIQLPTSSSIQAEQDWIKAQCDSIGEDQINQLVKQATENRSLSYSPYSNYKVGVALLGISGQIYNGANCERVSYSETDHGEESAVTAAILGGEMEKSGRKFIKAIAVSHGTNTAPCGRCRQIIVEHCDNAVIILVNPEGQINMITSMKILLPNAFTPSDLGK